MALRGSSGDGTGRNRADPSLPEIPEMSRARLIACVLLPFAMGYFLSYLFRTVNAVIAADLAAELNLGAADLGLLTSVYFLVFAAVQLPLGALLDRFGPGLVQSVLMLFACFGSLIFSSADGLVGLVIGRAFIGLGVAVALMAGIKAIGMWFPPDRLALATGWLVTLGALGAVTATGPTELVVQHIGWRGLFVVLAGLSAIAALVVLFAAPEPAAGPASPRAMAKFSAIYRDARFWRVAPLSALGVSTSWSLQGLWAAPWLRDVEGFERAAVVDLLAIMALAVCASALLLGAAADRLRRIGVKTECLLVLILGLSMLAQVALVLRWPLPPVLPWTIIAAAGAATVLSFALMSEYFPRTISGRANGALNLLHVSGAFALQLATGFIIEQWPDTRGAYPADAHQAAMAVPLGLQVAAAAWFAIPRRRPALSTRRAALLPSVAPTRYVRPHSVWRDQLRLARNRATRWQVAAIVSMSVTIALATVLASTGDQATSQIPKVEFTSELPWLRRWPALTTVTLPAGPGGLVPSRAASAPYGRIIEAAR